MKERPDVTVIVPVYNEEESIDPLYNELKPVLNGLKKQYEIIFVNDGSTDGSRQILRKLNKRDRNLRVIEFRRNFGKSAALAEGFRKAEGEIVITLDGDLQDDPREIPAFISKINEGFDLVVGWKHKRRDPLTKRIPSKIFNALTVYLTGVKVHDSNCCFKAYRREAVEKLKIYGELHRYIPALLHWKGYRVTEIKVKHRKRIYGKTKYGVMRLFKGLLDLITVKFLISYANRPLHFFGGMGMISFLLGSAVGIYLMYLKFLNYAIGDRPLLILAVLLIILGMQFISIGLLGEMIVSGNKEDEDLGIEST